MALYQLVHGAEQMVEAKKNEAAEDDDRYDFQGVGLKRYSLDGVSNQTFIANLDNRRSKGIIAGHEITTPPGEADVEAESCNSTRDVYNWLLYRL